MTTVAALGWPKSASDYSDLKAEMRGVHRALGGGKRFRVYFPVEVTTDENDLRTAFQINQHVKPHGDEFGMILTTPHRWMWFDSDDAESAAAFRDQWIRNIPHTDDSDGEDV